MEINMELINELYTRMLAIKARATDVITNSQKQHGEYASLSDSQRLFCAFLAAQADSLLSGCATKIGVSLDQEYPDGIDEAVRKFYTESAGFLGTHPSMTEAGYRNAVAFLLQSADDIVARAERVLAGQGSLVSS